MNETKLTGLTKLKELKIKLITAGILILAAVLVVAGVLLWHRREMEHQRAELTAQQEADRQLQDAIKKLENENGVLLEEKSDLALMLDEAKIELDEALTVPVAVIDAAAVKEDIEDISELATVEYKYTNVGVLDEKKQFSFWAQDIPFTEKRALIVMDGTIKAGIDCKQVKVESDPDKMTVTVTLPKAEILSNELDENSLHVVADEQSIFNKLTQQDHNDLRKQIKARALENAKNSSVLQQADERVQLLIKDLIESIPNVKGNYTIVFETVT